MKEVDSCTGFKESCDSVTYKPFEYPIIGKIHLCEKCLLKWSKLTCLFVYPKTLQEATRR